MPHMGRRRKHQLPTKKAYQMKNSGKLRYQIGAPRLLAPHETLRTTGRTAGRRHPQRAPGPRHPPAVDTHDHGAARPERLHRFQGLLPAGRKRPGARAAALGLLRDGGHAATGGAGARRRRWQGRQGGRHGVAPRPDVSELVFAVLGAAQDPAIVPLGSAFAAPGLFPLQRLGKSLARSSRFIQGPDTVASLPRGDEGPAPPDRAALPGYGHGAAGRRNHRHPRRAGGAEPVPDGGGPARRPGRGRVARAFTPACRRWSGSR
jgi:hypothetical protein